VSDRARRAPSLCAHQCDCCRVRFILANVKSEVKEANLHPKFPEIGTRRVCYHNEILLEAGDAKDIEQGEEVTLIQWGNAIVQSIERDASGAVVTLRGISNPEVRARD
jgi:hypothetical protein